MTGEEIGREKKARRMARAAIAGTISVFRDQAGDALWETLAKKAGEKLGPPSEATRKRVLEILEEIAI